MSRLQPLPHGFIYVALMLVALVGQLCSAVTIDSAIYPAQSSVEILITTPAASPLLGDMVRVFCCSTAPCDTGCDDIASVIGHCTVDADASSEMGKKRIVAWEYVSAADADPLVYSVTLSLSEFAGFTNDLTLCDWDSTLAAGSEDIGGLAGGAVVSMEVQRQFLSVSTVTAIEYQQKSTSPRREQNTEPFTAAAPVSLRIKTTVATGINVNDAANGGAGNGERLALAYAEDVGLSLEEACSSFDEDKYPDRDFEIDSADCIGNNVHKTCFWTKDFIYYPNRLYRICHAPNTAASTWGGWQETGLYLDIRREWHVSTHDNAVYPGNDHTGQGTLLKPWATIQHAVRVVNDGDTIWVRKGVYSGSTWPGLPPQDTAAPLGREYFKWPAIRPGNKHVNIRGLNGPKDTVIDCENSDFGLVVPGHKDRVNFNGVSIRRCNQFAVQSVDPFHYVYDGPCNSNPSSLCV